MEANTGRIVPKVVRRLSISVVALLATVGVTCAPANGDRRRSIADSAAREQSFNGVLAVFSGSRTIYQQAFGSANRETRTPMAMTTRFQVGSISKWFTAIIALKLLEQGKLDLDAPIGRYLSSYPSEVGNRVTVADVLSNTSGIKDRLPTELINDPRVAASALTAAQAVTVYGQGPLTFEPGRQFDYSHTNWVIAQAILERAGGRPLETLLREMMFEPLHLTATGVTRGSFEQVHHHAIAYASKAPGASREMHIIPNFLIPTGTIYSDCHDLVRAAHAVYDGGFLKAESLKTLNEIHYAPEEYALGGRVRHRSLNGALRTVAFEIGSFGGFKALVEHVPGDDVTVVALNNTNMSENELSILGDRLLAAAYLARTPTSVSRPVKPYAAALWP